VNQADAAELKATLTGVSLPATRPDLLEYAVRQHAEPPLLAALRSLPAEKEFTSLDDVVEELLRVQPVRNGGRPPEPTEESGAPPGGDAYTR
jgi:hypothetical protein